LDFRKKLRLLLIAIGFFLVSPVLAEAPPALVAYGDLPGIEDMSISPSGKGLAIVGEIDGKRQLVVLDGDRKIRRLSTIGDAKLRYIYWAGEDIVVVVISATQNLGFGYTTDKFEAVGALVVTLDKQPPAFIFSNTPSIPDSVSGNFGTRLVGDKWTGFFGGIEFISNPDHTDWEFDHGRPALFSVDLATNTSRRIARSAPEGRWRDWLVDGNGKAAVTLEVRIEDGKWTITSEDKGLLATGTDPHGNVSLVAFGSQGNSVIYSLEDHATEQIRWYEVPLAGGQATEVLKGIAIKRTYVDPTNGRLLGYLRDEAPARPVLFDPVRQAILTRVYRAFPKLDLEIEQWTPDMSHFLVKTSGNNDSGTWFVVDIAARKADIVGIERPRIGPAMVGPISTVSYHAADGMELDGILTLPPGRQAKNLPVVLFPHGGPNSRDEAKFDWLAQAFASRGYAVFQPNFRGSTNRDHAFVRAGYGQWGRKMQTDISDGLAELARQGIVDPKRACIVGASYGGYAALAGVTLQQGIYRCAVSVAGVSDLGQMYNTDYYESGGNKMLRRNLKESLGDPSTFNAVSPRRSAARADAPIMLIHGKNDTVVGFKQSDDMAHALKDAGKPYELVVLREEDHWLSHAATRKQMLEAAMHFVQQHNPAD
jgi:dipeptidyl aminopeptidase/acylaminoacyl peptidase